MCTEKGMHRVRLRYQCWKTSSFVFKALVSVHVSTPYRRTGNTYIVNRQSFVSKWMPDFQIPWLEVAHAVICDAHALTKIRAATTIRLHVGAKVTETIDEHNK